LLELYENAETTKETCGRGAAQGGTCMCKGEANVLGALDPVLGALDPVCMEAYYSGCIGHLFEDFILK